MCRIFDEKIYDEIITYNSRSDTNFVLTKIKESYLELH